MCKSVTKDVQGDPKSPFICLFVTKSEGRFFTFALRRWHSVANQFGAESASKLALSGFPKNDQQEAGSAFAHPASLCVPLEPSDYVAVRATAYGLPAALSEGRGSWTTHPDYLQRTLQRSTKKGQERDNEEAAQEQKAAALWFGKGSPQMRQRNKRSIPCYSSKLVVLNGLDGAGRGNRTPTVLSDLRILSPLRLPISPSRLAIILAYHSVDS
jgi:hypothetical protein